MAVVLYDDFNDAPDGQGVQHRPGWVNHPTSRFSTMERFVATGDGLAHCNSAGSTSWGIVIGADTVVVLDDVVFGKPLDRAEAVGMLTKLAGRTHTVLTGVVVMRASTVFKGVESTEVTFVELTSARIDWYVSRGESDDKAGAYAAQGVGSRLIERINGSYTNVVGLPMAMVDRFVRKFERNL